MDRSTDPFPLLFARPRAARSGGDRPRPDVIAEMARLFGRLSAGDGPGVVLLVTRSEDESADRLARSLLRRGAAVRRLNVDAVNRGVELALRVGGGGLAGELRLPTGDVPAGSVKSVWFRRYPTNFVAAEAVGTEAEEFALQETGGALSGLPSLLAGALWVNAPAAAYQAQSKLAQLAAAQALGFSVPRTLVTNSEGEAREFVASCRGGAVVKTFNWLFSSSFGNDWIIYTSRVRPEHLAELHRVRRAPCILQEEVEREAEVRVTVVGRKVFAIASRSDAGRAGPVDWRDPEARLRLEPAELPDEVAEACRALLRQWGLAFAALDLIRRPDGEYVFLELNTHGNWVHLEESARLPITDAIAELLDEAKVGG